MAEAVQQAVGADRRINEVRYGTFAEEGAVGQEYLPNGMSPNLLPAKWAEYEGYPDDFDVLYDTGGEGDSWVENTLGFNMLVVDPAGGDPATFHLPYLDKLTDAYIKLVEGQTYIYSYSAIVPPWDDNSATRYLGLRVQAASDAAGAGNSNIFTNTNTPAGLTPLEGKAGNQARIYAKFTVPIGKPWIRIHHRILYDIIQYPYTGYNWNMLEIVNDSRSFPSKYAAPTPRAGELTPAQLAFGEGANVLPFSKASLAAFEGPITVNGVAQGTVNGTTNGLGYYFLANGDNAWWTPASNIGTTSNNPTADRLKPGQWYIASVYVTNLQTANRQYAQIRVGTADNASDINTRTGTWQVKATGAEVSLDPGESKRVFVKFQHDAIASDSTVGAIGPRLEAKGRRTIGSGTTNTMRVDNYMVEEVDPISTAPSKYSIPNIARNELEFGQIEITPAVHVRQSTNQNIGNGVTGTINLDTMVYDYNFGGSQNMSSVNYVQIYRKGLYLISSNVLWTLSGVDGNNRLILYIRSQLSGVNTEYQLASQIAPAISGDGGISGSIQLPLQGIEASGGVGHRIFVRCANTSESALRTVTACRLMITYLGDNVI